MCSRRSMPRALAASAARGRGRVRVEALSLPGDTPSAVYRLVGSTVTAALREFAPSAEIGSEKDLRLRSFPAHDGRKHVRLTLFTLIRRSGWSILQERSPISTADTRDPGRLATQRAHDFRSAYKPASPLGRPRGDFSEDRRWSVEVCAVRTLPTIRCHRVEKSPASRATRLRCRRFPPPPTRPLTQVFLVGTLPLTICGARPVGFPGRERTSPQNLRRVFRAVSPCGQEDIDSIHSDTGARRVAFRERGSTARLDHWAQHDHRMILLYTTAGGIFAWNRTVRWKLGYHSADRFYLALTWLNARLGCILTLCFSFPYVAAAWKRAEEPATPKARLSAAPKPTIARNDSRLFQVSRMSLARGPARDYAALAEPRTRPPAPLEVRDSLVARSKSLASPLANSHRTSGFAVWPALVRARR